MVMMMMRIVMAMFSGMVTTLAVTMMFKIYVHDDGNNMQ